MLRLIIARRRAKRCGLTCIGLAILVGSLTPFTATAAECQAWALPGTNGDGHKAGGAAGTLMAQERGEQTQTPAERYLPLEDELARKGEEALAAEDYARAERIFRSLTQHNPEDIRGFLGLGKVYCATSQYSGAADTYYEALRLDRNNVAALMGLGKVNLALLKWDQAFEFFQEVAEIDEKRADAQRYIEDLIHGRLGEEEGFPAEYYRIVLSPGITREELAALVYVRSFRLQAVTSEPELQIMTDISDRWARPYILEVTKHGIMSVFPNHTFMPKTAVTRGQFAQVLHNLVQLVGIKEAYQDELRKEIILTDVDPSNRYYSAIRAICSLGIMGPVANSSFNPSDLIPGSEAVEAFNKLETVANLALSAKVLAPSTAP